MLPLLLPVLNVHLPQPLEPALEGLHIVLAGATWSGMRDGDGDVFGVDPWTGVALLAFLFDELGEVGDELLEGHWSDTFELERGDA